MAISKLFLVDSDGVPISSRITEAVERVAPRIRNRYENTCDPAEIDNCIEEAARSIVVHEEDHGPVKDIIGFASRVVSNGIISLFRKTSRLQCTSSGDLITLAGEARENSPDDIYAGIYEREALDMLPLRDRQICVLEYQGFTASQIATALNMTTEAVWQAHSRRCAKFAKEGLSQ